MFKFMFKFKPYQYEDISRSAMHDGAILGWDPGRGRTMATFCWPVLKHSRRTLIIAPAGLHEHIIKVGQETFKVHVQPIANQKHFVELVAAGKLHYHIDQAPVLPDAPLIMPDYFIADYHWLTPALSTLMANAFDCVVCEEVRLKSGTKDAISIKLNTKYLLHHFHIPIPQDIAELHPEKHQENLALLNLIEARINS